MGIFFRTAKRIAIINGSFNFIVKFNFVLPLQKLVIDPLLRNEPCTVMIFYLVIKWSELAPGHFISILPADKLIQLAKVKVYNWG